MDKYIKLSDICEMNVVNIDDVIQRFDIIVNFILCFSYILARLQDDW